MAETTPFSKVEHTRNHGARVLLEGLIFDEAKQFALDLCERRIERLLLLTRFLLVGDLGRRPA